MTMQVGVDWPAKGSGSVSAVVFS